MARSNRLKPDCAANEGALEAIVYPCNISRTRSHAPSTAGTPLRYIDHIQKDIEDFSVSGISSSRLDVLERLSTDNLALLPTNRVALTGRLGIGKTYIAMAYVYRLMRRSKSTPIFWVTLNQLETDCKAITQILGLKPLTSSVTPLDWLCKILRRLSSSIIGPWLVVIDGANISSSDEPRILKLSETKEGAHGYILITTRHLDTAENFLNGGLNISVGPLDPVDAANLLGHDTPTPLSGVFDEIAHSLDFDPFVTTKVRTFLDMTGMPAADFATQLCSLLNEDSWSTNGEATAAASLLSRKQRQEGRASTMLQSPQCSLLVPVLRSCLNPSWLFLFDSLADNHPAAAELLASLSVLGRSSVPKPLLAANAAIRCAARVLMNQCFLTERTDDVYGSRLMLVAHRVWLAERSGFHVAYKSALKMIACEYPDARTLSGRSQCKAFEPLAKASTSATADSWTQEDHACVLLRSMLLQKRSSYKQE